MKRGFLFGLGSFLILGVIGCLLRFETATVIVALVLTCLTVVTIRAANRAPANRSWPYAIIGWLFGFLAVHAVILVCVGVIFVLWALSNG
jgi:uncharacterized membrane protein AbrB (regulator of aidB expression)